MWFGSGLRCFPHGRVGGPEIELTDPQSQETPGLHRPRCLTHSGHEFLLAAYVPMNSCTSPRRHGRITHQPQDAPYGGFGPDLPCYPPMSHGSSRFEVHDRRTRSESLSLRHVHHRPQGEAEAIPLASVGSVVERPFRLFVSCEVLGGVAIWPGFRVAGRRQEVTAKSQASRIMSFPRVIQTSAPVMTR